MENAKSKHTMYDERKGLIINEENLKNYLHNMTFNITQTVQETLTGGRTSLPQVDSSPELQFLYKIMRELERVSRVSMFPRDAAGRPQNQKGAEVKEGPENQQKPEESPKLKK